MNSARFVPGHVNFLNIDSKVQMRVKRMKGGESNRLFLEFFHLSPPLVYWPQSSSFNFFFGDTNNQEVNL